MTVRELIEVLKGMDRHRVVCIAAGSENGTHREYEICGVIEESREEDGTEIDVVYIVQDIISRKLPKSATETIGFAM